MANIFNEVDEDIRKERYKNLWNKYGKFIIGFLVLIVIIFSLSQYLQSKKISENKKILDIYFSSIEKFENNQLELARRDLETVYSEKNNMLTAMSGLKLSEIFFSNNQKEQALDYLEKVFNNNTLERVYRELALYKYFIINFENLSIGNIELMIESVGVDGNTLNPYYQEIIGIKYLTLGKIKKANAVFENLSQNENTPFDLRLRLDKLIKIAS